MIAVIAAMALAAQAQPPRDFTWHSAEPAGRSVEWGNEVNGRRGLRIECRAGTLFILGPSHRSEGGAVPTQVSFRRGEAHVTLLGVTVDNAAGLDFEVPVGAGELPVATLLAGDTLGVEEGGEGGYEVPGVAAPALLAPLVAACRR